MTCVRRTERLQRWKDHLPTRTTSCNYCRQTLIHRCEGCGVDWTGGLHKSKRIPWRKRVIAGDEVKVFIRFFSGLQYMGSS